MTSKIPDTLMAEVATVPGRLVSAWAAHDAKAISALFLQDGTLILPGVYKKGRDEIRNSWRPATPTVQVNQRDRYPARDQAVGQAGDSRILDPGQGRRHPSACHLLELPARPGEVIGTRSARSAPPQATYRRVALQSLGRKGWSDERAGGPPGK